MKKLYTLTFLAAVLLTACASPKGDSTANNNAAQPAISGQSGQQPVAQPPQPSSPNGTGTPATPTTIPDVAKVIETPSQPAVGQPPADENAPDLLVPTKEIDFGKQPKETKLTRSITIKNGGKSDLEIMSVSPS